MLPEIFLFVICLGLPLLTKGRDLTETILLSKFKVNVKVNCRALDETGSSFRHWILPNLVVVGGNVSENSPTNIIVWPGNFSLGIRRIADDQMGDYLCHAVDSNGRPLYSRTSVFLYVAPVWETYRLNFIVSLSASGTFAVIATVFCVVNSLRWRKTAPDHINDNPLPVKSNGSEGSRSDLELSTGPKVMTSEATATDEVTEPRVTRFKVVPALEKDKCLSGYTEVDDDTPL